MSRFSQWRGAQLKRAALAQAAEEEEEFEVGDEYRVDNSILQSKCRGIRYRRTPNTDDPCAEAKVAKFGTHVRGDAMGNWLRVRTEVGWRYLPMVMDGAVVLLPKSAAKRAPAVLRQAEEAWDAEEERLARAKEEERPHWLKEDSDNLRGVDAEPQRRETKTNTAEWHVVVSERAIVRREPSMDSLMENFKLRGSLIELYEWDSTKQWRKCLEAGTNYGFPGWMRLDHPQHGPLLRPLELLCVAAMQNDVEQLRLCLAGRKLRGWRGAGNTSPLRLAAERGHLECCVLLLEAGADAEPIFEEDAPPLENPIPVKPLIAALSGRDFVVRDFEAALEQLPARAREKAEELLDQVAEKLAAQRLGKAVDSGDDQTQPPPAEDAPWSDDDEAAHDDELPEGFNSPPRRRHLGAEMDEPPAEDFHEEEFHFLGHGALYEVVHKGVFIRKDPFPTSEGIGTRLRGDFVELLEFDRTGNWGLVQMGLNPKHKEPRKRGWMMIQSQHLGELLRPVPMDNSGPGFYAEDEEEEQEQEPSANDEWNRLFWRR